VTELARRFAAGDSAGALALFHPDLRVQQPASLPHGGWHHGADGGRLSNMFEYGRSKAIAIMARLRAVRVMVAGVKL
jgi:hypothetical protein